MDQRRPLMKEFWDSKARENARFYIATWLGYKTAATAEFFETAESIDRLLRSHGYEPAGGRMLEIGCGIGRMTRGFSGLFDSVDAIDVSAEMVTQARWNVSDLPNVSIHETSGVDLALFSDGVFEFCFSYIVFQHLPDFSITRNYILEVGRALKPGGSFLFQVNNLPKAREYRWRVLRRLSMLWRRYGRHTLLELQAALARGPRGFDHAAWLGHAVIIPDLDQAIAAAGLEYVHMSGQGTAYLWVLARKPSLH